MDLQNYSDKQLKLSNAIWLNLGGSNFLVSFQSLEKCESNQSIQDIISLLMENIHDWNNVKINNKPFEFSENNLKIAFRDAEFLKLMASTIFDKSKFS